MMRFAILIAALAMVACASSKPKPEPCPVWDSGKWDTASKPCEEGEPK